MKEYVEIRRNEDDSLDEIVGYGYFHLEQMASGHWWIGFGSPLTHVNLYSMRKITANYEQD